jgi:hypothetical protein
MTTHIAAVGLSCLLIAGCNTATPPVHDAQGTDSKMPADRIQLVFLTRDGCANTPTLLANLKDAAQTFDTAINYEVIDQGTLLPSDPRAGYATPTILYNNRDLFGLTEPTPPFPAPS